MVPESWRRPHRHSPLTVAYLALVLAVAFGFVLIRRDAARVERLDRDARAAAKAADLRALEATPFNPLGQYPQQTVVSRVDGVPGVKIGTPLVVRALKCNSVSAPVVVDGSAQWQLIAPPGTGPAVAFGGQALRLPGCTEWTDAERSPGTSTVFPSYRNEVPAEIAEYVRAQAARGVSTTWVISGQETPVDPDCGLPAFVSDGSGGQISTLKLDDEALHNGVCQVGAKRLYTTEPFTITP